MFLLVLQVRKMWLKAIKLYVETAFEPKILNSWVHCSDHNTLNTYKNPTLTVTFTLPVISRWGILLLSNYSMYFNSVTLDWRGTLTNRGIGQDPGKTVADLTLDNSIQQVAFLIKTKKGQPILRAWGINLENQQKNPYSTSHCS